MELVLQPCPGREADLKPYLLLNIAPPPHLAQPGGGYSAHPTVHLEKQLSREPSVHPQSQASGLLPWETCWAVLPDSGPQPKSHVSLWACSTTYPGREAGSWPYLLQSRAFSPTCPGSLTRTPRGLCGPPYSPACSGTKAERPACDSAHLQSWASGPVWPGSSADIFFWFGSPASDPYQPWSLLPNPAWPGKQIWNPFYA